MRSPKDFLEVYVPRVRRMLAQEGRGRGVVVRPHPGKGERGPHGTGPSLWEQLRGCSALVTWASNCANLALLWGFPAYRAAPHHVNPAVSPVLDGLLRPDLPERRDAFEAVAWAQWGLSEIESGKAFRSLMRDVL